MDTINYTEQEVECVECSTIVPSSEAELTGTEGWGICDRCGDEEEELDAWCYRCDKHFSADTEEGGDDGTEEEEWICNSCFKDINKKVKVETYEEFIKRTEIY